MRFGLQQKGLLLVLLVAAVPVAVTAIFIDDIAVAAQNVAEGEAARLEEALRTAQGAYHEAVAARKESFRLAAEVAAQRPELRTLCEESVSGTDADAVLQKLVDGDESLFRASLKKGEATLGRAARAVREDYRMLPVERPLAGAPACRLSLVYATPGKIVQDLEELGRVLQERRDRARIRGALPRSYEIGFLILVGAFVTLAALVAILAGRRITKRIHRLVAATRRVGEGDLDARVSLKGSDELADLARSFDQMVDDLKRSRAEIEYLQKIGAWQEVARRLAHEIKNPLTPIQLAVQELHRKYDGDDARYRKILDEAHTIVTEEIGGLRRLVDAFRGFAKLPRVEPKPLAIADLVEDVAREHEIEKEAPAESVTISGDRFLLKRALLNLVENARHAGATRVRIAWSRSGDTAVLVVDDDGPGVPESMVDRLFDPYVTGSEEGTGLGLAIVKKTILEHRGKVMLAPERSPLGGARFEIRLPSG